MNKMTSSEKTKYIISICTEQINYLTREYINYASKFSASQAEHEAWENNNPKNGIGGFSQNPYNPGINKKYMDNYKRQLDCAKEVLEFANNIFLDMIEG